jgi:hypothetical protein
MPAHASETNDRDEHPECARREDDDDDEDEERATEANERGPDPRQK